MSGLIMPVTDDAPLPRHWTREEYHRAGDMGLFGPEERLELIGGEVLRKVSPQRSPHAAAICFAEEALRKLPDGYSVRIQMPLAISEHDEPEPDIAVVTGKPRDYVRDHPETSVLVIEVADSTIRFDRTVKSSLYASAGIPEYLIVNLRESVLEVRRNPHPASNTPFEHDYAFAESLDRKSSFVSEAIPDLRLKVSELLP